MVVEYFSCHAGYVIWILLLVRVAGAAPSVRGPARPPDQPITQIHKRRVHHLKFGVAVMPVNDLPGPVREGNGGRKARHQGFDLGVFENYGVGAVAQEAWAQMGAVPGARTDFSAEWIPGSAAAWAASGRPTPCCVPDWPRLRMVTRCPSTTARSAAAALITPVPPRKRMLRGATVSAAESSGFTRRSPPVPGGGPGRCRRAA